MEGGQARAANANQGSEVIHISAYESILAGYLLGAASGAFGVMLLMDWLFHGEDES